MRKQIGGIFVSVILAAASCVHSVPADAQAAVSIGKSPSQSIAGARPVQTNDGGSNARKKSTPREATLETVVVTAEKREQKVQDIPASISVVSGENLAEVHATSMLDWAGTVPGLNAVPSVNGPGEGGETVAIDGIPPISAGSSEVKVYVGDVPLGSSGGFALSSAITPDLLPYDVDRVEVLRGPQGTLYGASSMGGVIRYVLNTPDLSKFSAEVGADAFAIQDATPVDNGGGAGGQYRASVNVPLINDVLGFRASLYDQYTPGFIDDLATGQKDDNARHEKGGRFDLLWRPSTDVSIEASALDQSSEQNNLDQVIYNPTTRQPFAGGSALSNIYPLSQQYTYQELNLYDLTAIWDMHWAKLTSISSYQRLDMTQFDDASVGLGHIFGELFGTPFDDESVSPGVKKFTQEARLASPSGQALEWMIGGYYTHETEADLDLLNGYASASVLAPVAGLDPLEFSNVDSTYAEYALFGNLTWHITKRFDVTGGTRYAYNDQSYFNPVGGPLNGTPPGVVSTPISAGESHQGVVTWSVSPSYHIDDNTMVYVHVATGYQPGGPTGSIPSISSGLPLPKQYRASTLIDYETGLKSSFLDNRASVDLSAFYINWSEIQVPIQYVPVGILTGNGASARSEGADVTAKYSPLEGLVLGANVTYTDSIMTAAVPALFTASGARLPYIPLWASSVTADYLTPIDERWNLLAGGDYRYTGSMYSSVEGATSGGNLTGGLDKSYSVIDLHTGVADDSWKIMLYVRNLTNDLHLSGTLTIYQVGSHTPVGYYGSILQPRTIGISVDKSF